MAREKPGQTLQATALVHEAYLRLVKNNDDVAWDSRGHFFASAAEAMRRILIDRARQKQRPKHGGDRQEARSWRSTVRPATRRRTACWRSTRRLAKLEQEQPEIAQLVKLRYFAGVPLKDAAPLLGVSLATAKRRWAFARAFLYGELAD